MRDIESLCDKAGLGKLSKTTAQRVCSELREHLEHLKGQPVIVECMTIAT